MNDRYTERSHPMQRIEPRPPDLERAAMLIRLITILAVGGLLIATALAFR